MPQKSVAPSGLHPPDSRSMDAGKKNDYIYYRSVTTHRIQKQVIEDTLPGESTTGGGCARNNMGDAGQKLVNSLHAEMAQLMSLMDDAYLVDKAKNLVMDPTAPVPTAVDDDRNQDIAANAGDLADHLRTAIEALQAIQKIIVAPST